MERIYKIRIKTDKEPQSQFPSERRYSASMVIGLSIVFFQLFLYSVLMGTLIIHKMTIQPCPNKTLDQNDTYIEQNVSPKSIDANDTNSILLLHVVKLQEKVNEDLDIIIEQNKNIMRKKSQNSIDLPVLMCSGCFLMALGYILSFSTGILAWKRWYIDHNITIFFLASSFSTLTAAIGLLLSILTCINLNFDYDTYSYEFNYVSPITISLALNITILSTIGVIWSILASKFGYVGMKASYPDDMVLNEGGRFEQVTINQKGKNCEVFSDGIIEHFPPDQKLAKYLPKKENDNLPKSESTLEYKQRVDRFLSEVPENSAKNCGD